MAASTTPGFDSPGGGSTPYVPPPQVGQNWHVDATGDTITFAIAPANAAAITVNEYGHDDARGSAKFAIGSWCPAYGYPSEIEFFSDRLWLANTPTDPQTVWASNTGDYTNHGRNTPMIDSDAIAFTINARQVNAIMDLVPLDKMLLLAKGGEFLMTGGQDDVVTPTSINIRPQSYRGTGGLQARVVGDTAIMVQEQGSHVYDVGYRFEADGYRPQDISLWADHLVEGHTITQLDWMPAPWSVLWLVREDGVQLGCTYMPEQEVVGWHRHDTGRTRAAYGTDSIEDVVVLPGTQQSETFALVRRTIDGVTKRYIEQLAHKHVDDIRDWHYMDSGLVYDGRNDGTDTVTLTGAGWTEADTIVLTATAPLFSGAGDIGDMLLIERTMVEADENGEAIERTYSVRVQIAEYTSPTVVGVFPIGEVPAPLRAIALTGYTVMRNTIGGLDHLEGRRVAILSDASVLSNGFTGTSYVVEAGSITLPRPGGVVHVGLPYRSHVETLPFTLPGGESIRGDKKLLTKVGLQLRESRGAKTCGGPLDESRLYDVPVRELETYGEPTRPVSGYVEVPVDTLWGIEAGVVHVISDDPVPLELLALIPRFVSSATP